MTNDEKFHRLLESAWEYVILHNRLHPEDPRFVDPAERCLVTDKAPCEKIEGVVIHKGHGPGNPCGLTNEG